MRILSLLSVIHFCSFSLYGTWLERKAEGWAWYEKKETKEEKKETVQEERSPTEKILSIKKSIEDKLSQAILNPTSSNIENYLREQKKWLDQSQHFAENWHLLLLSHPELDQTVTSPTTQYGAQFYKEKQRLQKNKLFEELSKEYGLFFCFQGESKECQVFADVVQAFATKYQWTVVPIAVDGKSLPQYPEAKKDEKMQQTLIATVLPALYLVHPKEEIIVPISFGLNSLDRIEDNIFAQFNTENTEKEISENKMTNSRDMR